MSTVLWFRRDLRLADHPALADAAQRGPVLPVFVLDERLWARAGANRRWFLSGCLRALAASTGGCLVVRRGDPVAAMVELAEAAGADRVVVTADHGPHGRRRDRSVAVALAERRIAFDAVDSNYAVAPGSVTKADGGAYSVFTPFSRAWRATGWPDPIAAPSSVSWAEGVGSDGVPDVAVPPAALPTPGEEAAAARLDAFAHGDADRYDLTRDRPADDATSRLSAYLHFGCLHPRQVLAVLGPSPGAAEVRRQLAWREFYADVLWHRPETAHETMQPSMRAMAWSEGPGVEEDFDRWRAGRTGYPIVDAGMRQLIAEGWMHNRMRLITASFLVKDLHIDWRRGARHFMDVLVDADVASNQHNWQWVAGTGTDPSPFFRVFNPVTQGRRFDPDGAYIRRYVPELVGLDAAAIHEPWRADPATRPAGYPAPMVDHAEERQEALRRYGATR